MNHFIDQLLEQGYEGVLFDIDGTLLDSMGMWYDIDVRFMKKINTPMPEDLQMQIAGMSMYETAIYFKENFGLSETPEELMEIWNNMARDAYLYDISMKEGAEEFISLLHERQIPIACATSNSKYLVEAAVSSNPSLQLMDAIVTADEVKNGKPAPDVYITAASKINVNPKKCLVFEDVIQGVRAANAAGCNVICIEDKHSESQLREKLQESMGMIRTYFELGEFKLS